MTKQQIARFNVLMNLLVKRQITKAEREELASLLNGMVPTIGKLEVKNGVG